MGKQSMRMILLLGMFFIGMSLHNLWQHEQQAKQQAKQESIEQKKETEKSNDLPSFAKDLEDGGVNKGKDENGIVEDNRDARDLISVKTDTMQLKITKAGGDIVFLELSKYPVSIKDNKDGVILLDKTKDRNYIVQSGLMSPDGPDSKTKGRAEYFSKQKEYSLSTEQNNLNVDLKYQTKDGVTIIKRFVFTKGKYSIDVDYLIKNEGRSIYKGRFYGRLRRAAPEKDKEKGMASRTYTGAAVTTADKKYLKITFSDMGKKQFGETISHGWAAMEEHYFTTAWVPKEDKPYQYVSEAFSDNTFSIGFVGSSIIVQPGEEKTIGATLYAGPGIMSSLQKIAPGLELTVDYGILWWICQPIFYLMDWLYSLVGNWGVSIIFVTVIIKLAFYKLSASSYRSMGNMRKLQPKMEELKARYGDDKQKYGQAVMELYRKEKINPLGGCLPILIQIPVFIALYYVLLESVELRQAPFALWIHDLSTKDPYYVLPLIMGASMFLQQRMNPAPPDPIQAKMMMAMPLVFTVLFLQFPSGLVLYWVVNNILSILQQWMITRSIK